MAEGRTTCAEGDCDSAARTRGLCRAHHQRRVRAEDREMRREAHRRWESIAQTREEFLDALRSDRDYAADIFAEMAEDAVHVQEHGRTRRDPRRGSRSSGP